MTLIAVLLPAVAMPLLLWLAPPSWSLPRLTPASWPVEFWCMAIAGTIATVAGVLDWRFHRSGGRRIAAAEHRAELAALTLGAPLFATLVAASVDASTARTTWLVPTVAIALVMAGLIVYDETRFHRACGRYETVLHRLLVIGNGVAFLCWLSWCLRSGRA